MGFTVVGIAGTDHGGEVQQLAFRRLILGQIGRLRAELGLDQLLPDPLAGGLAGIDLELQSRDQTRMVGEREQHAQRQMVSAAEDDDSPAAEQLGEESMRVRDLGMLDDQDAEIFAGDPGDDFVIAAELELLIADREISALLRNLDGAFEHELVAGNGGSSRHNLIASLRMEHRIQQLQVNSL
jgi:hypothetical protein